MVRFVLMMALILLLAVGCRGGKTSSYAIRGSLVLTQDFGFDIGDRPGFTFRKDEACVGVRGYDDVVPGAQVVIRNQDGKILATSVLGSGTNVSASTDTAINRCKFPFELPSVPKANFYAVKISNRGEITRSFEDMKTSDWRLDLTLGP